MSKPQQANRQIARAAGVVMAGFVLSNLTGLVRQILVSQAFGTQGPIEAFNAASRLPDLLFSLIAGGALASAFIPTFTGFLANEERKTAWHLASSIINLVLLVTTFFSAICVWLALPIVQHALAPGFSPEQQLLTAQLMRILLLSPIIFGVSGMMMGILNAHQSFVLPALAPTMYWLGWIFGVVALAPKWGIFGLAWGAVIGAGMHLSIQVPGLLKLPARRYVRTLGLHSAKVRQVGRLMAPRLLGVAVVQLNFWVNTLLASLQPVGSLTAIVTAWAVMTMPQVVIAQAIAIAAMPTFSEQVARGELAHMRASLVVTLRSVLLLAAPASVGLVLLRRPLVALMFQRGAFDAHSTDLVAWALLWYSVGLIGHSLVEIVSRAFYALHDTKTPVFVGAAAMSLNVVFSVLFAAWFVRIGWMPHGGLALANSLATALEMVALLILIGRKLDGLELPNLLRGAGHAFGGSLVMGGVLVIWMSRMGGHAVWLVGLGGVALGGGIYVLCLALLRTPEFNELLRFVGKRLRQKLAQP